jgi:hypothetical protein
MQKEKRARTLKVLSIYAGSILVLLIGISFLFHIQKFHITEIVVSGNKVLEEEKIKEIVNRRISGSYVFLFPKRNALIYPKGSIEKELRDTFGRIETLSIERTHTDTLVIHLTERTPKYLWCGEKNEETVPECYFTDEYGYIFDHAPYFSGSVYFKLYGTQGMDMNISPIRQHIINPELFTTLISFKDGVSRLGFIPEALVIGTEEGPYDAKILLYGKNNTPQIKFRYTDDVSKLYINLKSAVESEPLISELKNKKGTLNYIDIRFENKVFYTFK